MFWLCYDLRNAALTLCIVKYALTNGVYVYKRCMCIEISRPLPNRKHIIPNALFSSYVWNTASFPYVVDATADALWRWQLCRIISLFGEEPGHALTSHALHVNSMKYEN